MKQIYIYIICLLLASACKDYRTSIFEGETIIITQFPENDTLKGEKLNLEILGVNDLYVLDTFLIGFKGTGVDCFFEIYTLPGLQCKGKYIEAGRGNNELLTLQYDGQFQIKDNRVTMWLSDGAVDKRVLFNLTESLEKKQAVFDTIIHTPHYERCFHLNDSTIDIIQHIPANICLKRYDLKYHQNRFETNILKKIIPKEIPPFLLGIGFSMHPKKNKYVAHALYFNQLYICSSDLQRQISISYGEPIDIQKVINTPDSVCDFYYSSVVTTDKQIYALCINQPNYCWDRHDHGVELQIFDWEGMPENRIFIPEDIIYFAVDEKHKCMYGVKRNEEIYRYDLKTIL